MKNILLLLVFFSGQYLSAQTISDALRYSNINVAGTARSYGAGGAFGALGADYSVLSTNPAGLAMFRKNELVLTPSINFNRTESTLRGTTNTLDDNKSNFGFNNFGFIFNTTPRSKRSTRDDDEYLISNKGWSTFNIGNTAGTIMTGVFNESANVLNNGGTTDDLYPFTAKLAYDANAVYFQDDVLTYDFAGAENSKIDRNQSVLTTGAMQEMVISFAGNYEEKLNVGFTLGVPFINYKLEGSYEESDPTDIVPFFDKLTYTEYLSTNGVGANLKLGAQYKVNKVIRLGAAFHTPTFLTLTDTYSNTLQYGYTDGNGASAGEVQNSPDGTNDYRLRTPWRAIFSTAFIIKKYGFLSADIEMVDYSNSRFNLTANISNNETQLAERELNADLRKAYKQAVNMRLGGEYAAGKLRLRGGVNLLGNPIEGETDVKMAYTAGIGVRSDNYYVDLGYRHSNSKGTISPYADAVNQPVADLKSQGNEFLMTVGFRF
jgi:Outer membrane protein transport protein (OMPP1/FadL/TodX)